MFEGPRDALRAPPLRVAHDEVGVGLLYAGREIHRVEPLRRAGAHRERLVLWCRSSAWRAEYTYCDDEQADDRDTVRVRPR